MKEIHATGRISFMSFLVGTITFFYKVISSVSVAIWSAVKFVAIKYYNFVIRKTHAHDHLRGKIISSLVFIATPFILVLLFVITCVSVDQALEYDETVAPAFTEKTNNSLEIGAKGALLFQASHYQLEKMLNRFPYWSANDPWPYPQGWWDNSKNTQRGVWWATSQMVILLSDRITRYGTGQPQNPLTLFAFEKLNIGSDEWNWWMTDSETYFAEAIKSLKKYEAQARVNSKLVNIRTDDLEVILVAIKDKVLGEPYGRLTDRSSAVKNNEVDNVVKFSRGAAIVVRDVLCVMRSTFTTELAKGGLENLDAAIESLEAIIDFHPLWIERGEGDAMLGDHRAKLGRYYTEVFRRIEDLASSLRT